MKKRWFAGILVAVGLCCGYAYKTVAEDKVTLKVGDLAPAFELKDTEERSHRLGDYLGEKWVVLAWYPKAFTPGCTSECISLNKQRELLESFDVEIFAASTDTVEKNREFSEEYGFWYPLLCDSEGEVAKSYGILMPVVGLAKRVTFIIDPQGKIASINSKVDTSSSAAQLAQELERLGVPSSSK